MEEAVHSSPFLECVPPIPLLNQNLIGKHRETHVNIAQLNKYRRVSSSFSSTFFLHSVSSSLYFFAFPLYTPPYLSTPKSGSCESGLMESAATQANGFPRLFIPFIPFPFPFSGCPTFRSSNNKKK